MESPVKNRKEFEMYIKGMTMVCSDLIFLTSRGKKPTFSSDLFDKECERNMNIIDCYELPNISEKRNVINSLEISNSKTILLEIWTIGVREPACQTNSLALTRTKIDGVLENLLTLANTTVSVRLPMTPTTKLNSIKYSFTSKDEDYNSLGENYALSEVGQVPTPLGTLYVTLAVRTRIFTEPNVDKYFEGDAMLQYLISLKEEQEDDQNKDQKSNSRNDGDFIPVKRGRFDNTNADTS